MKIAIKFGDNDFRYTFTGVLRAIFNAYKGGYETIADEKEQLVIIINELSLASYLIHQNKFEYFNGQGMEGHIEHIRNYLKISKEEILTNDEVVEYLKTTDGDNSETFILDTDLDFPNNTCIYSI